MTLADLRVLLGNSNVSAFLRTIRARESSQDDSAYTILNGGSHFTGFADHPYKGQRTPPAKAAGAFQFIASTWAEVQAQYGIVDFGPMSQNLGAIGRIIYRDALDDVLAGRFESAVVKCRKEWTSLPGAAESSGSWTMDKAKAVYVQYGGTFAPKVGTELPKSGTEQPKRKAMDAKSVFGDIFAQLIPQAAKIFLAGSPYAPLADAAISAIVGATGAVNEQQAVEMMTDPVTGPAAVKQATAAVLAVPEVAAILEIGGGIPAARQADAAAVASDKPFFWSPAFWFTMLVVMPPVDYTIFMIMSQMKEPSTELITQVVTGMLGILAVAGAFYLGSSYGSQKKDEALASKGAK